MKNIMICLRTTTLCTITAISVAVLSCTDGSDEVVKEQPLGMYVSTSVTISVRNESGRDLLDPDLPNSFRKFKVYYLKDGAKQLYFDPMMSRSGGYSFDKYPFESAYHVRVLLDSPPWDAVNDNKWTTTYLEFEDGSTDTIRAQYTIKPGFVAIAKAFYNEALGWDLARDNGDLPTYVITK
ncbi:VOC family protein [Dyadobacter sp. BHUBP1]|uniref:VOC family protein n=1 Tax=Dyadobacter sp. BHUBP1 TaxID=3424178 RepID=UPI003D34642A